MSLKLFNSLTRSKENFTPIKKNQVYLYVCGITPNNATHLGHAFTYVSFDILKRYLDFSGYKTKYVQNATDLNDSDDVLKQAKEMGKTWGELADYWIKHFKKNMNALNVLEPDYYVKATSSIKKIIEISNALIEKGIAYEREGNVYFDTKKFANYGMLSRFSEEQMLFISRERGNNPEDPLKKNPLDFVLWLASSDKPFWKSPWPIRHPSSMLRTGAQGKGKGRPGWHIECSAMISDYLGEQIDIHGGGRDLIYPHHESEIAQSQSYTGKKPFAKYWMHTGMVLYEGEKMAKSLGNLVLVSDLLKKYDPNVIRLLILLHHYRKPWEFLEEELVEAEKLWEKVTKTLRKVSYNGKENLEDFKKLMDDDLNTPEVMRLVVSSLNSENMSEKKSAKKMLEVLGFII